MKSFKRIVRYFLFTIMIFSVHSCTKPDNTKQEKQADSTQESENNELSDSVVSINKVMGRFDPKMDDHFVLIDEQYADRPGMYLHSETYEAFKRMHAAAKSDQVQLIIRSATRNFYRQKEIWEAKWTGKRLIEEGEDLSKTTPDPVTRALKILRWSSMPGTSRHHWGTDIDINAFNNEYFETGEGKIVYGWMQSHASDYGFCQPYTEKDASRPNGYNEERWHWSYKPLADRYMQTAQAELKNEKIAGFLGSETAPKINVVEKYVFGISSACQH